MPEQSNQEKPTLTVIVFFIVFVLILMTEFFLCIYLYISLKKRNSNKHKIKNLRISVIVITLISCFFYGFLIFVYHKQKEQDGRNTYLLILAANILFVVLIFIKKTQIGGCIYGIIINSINVPFQSFMLFGGLRKFVKK